MTRGVSATAAAAGRTLSLLLALTGVLRFELEARTNVAGSPALCALVFCCFLLEGVVEAAVVAERGLPMLLVRLLRALLLALAEAADPERVEAPDMASPLSSSSLGSSSEYPPSPSSSSSSSDASPSPAASLEALLAALRSLLMRRASRAFWLSRNRDQMSSTPQPSKGISLADRHRAELAPLTEVGVEASPGLLVRADALDGALDAACFVILL